MLFLGAYKIKTTHGNLSFGVKSGLNFYSNEEQKHIAQAYIDQLNRAKVFRRPIVTQVAGLQTFNEAEAYHQDYLINHPDEPYILINDQPKVENLRQQLPGLYKTN